MKGKTYTNKNGNRLEYIACPGEFYRISIYNNIGYLIFSKIYGGFEAWLAEKERDGLIALGGFREDTNNAEN